MKAVVGLYSVAVLGAWLVHLVTLLGQAYNETLTLSKAAYHAVGLLLPALAPITVWFV